jgi:hypothetical protein
MILKGTDESGAEEWYCPTCGRRFLMQWPPNYKKTVLEPGDEYAIHTGGKGMPSLEMSMMPTASEPGLEDLAGEPTLVNVESLQPWIEWMEKVDFDSLWTRPIQ